MKNLTFLVIDDDPITHEIITKCYKKDKNIQIISASNGKEGLKALYKIRPDLIILDIMMPEMDGWETCRQIRLVSSEPIIMLTALSDEANVIRGLDNGADDFIGKPFNINNLQARVRAVLRRTKQIPEPDLINPGYSDEHLHVDFEKRNVSVDGEQINLTRTEHLLLEFMIRNKGKVLSYTDILINVWGWEYQDSPDYTHVYISHLRKKIDKPLANINYFHTVYGLGYRFEKSSN